MRTMTLALAMLIVALVAPLWACLWDSDTLSAEARGATDVVRAITGRFDRNPPIYYAMRLARAASRVEADPRDFHAYDDAGVACDRLGRPAEAIAWMDRKAKALADAERVGVPPDEQAVRGDDRYRMLANLGTFRIHRWIQAGADRSATDDLRLGRDAIAEALRINPQAHFGREGVQLAIADGLLNPALRVDSGYLPPLIDLPVDPGVLDASIAGLTGIITLGAGFESVDVLHTLQLALLKRGHSSLAELAGLRVDELVAAGKRSMIPGASTDPKSLAMSARPHPGLGFWYDDAPNPAMIEQTFATLRSEAESTHAARLAFMLPRLESGRHPDTDRDFWSGYDEPKAPDLGGELVPIPAPRSLRDRLLARSDLFATIAILVASYFVIRRIFRRDRRAATAATRA